MPEKASVYYMETALKWTSRHIPDLSAKVVLITGACSGIGLETAKALAAHRATVVVACKSFLRYQEAFSRMPDGHKPLFIAPLDLSDLSSIHRFVNAFKQKYRQLHILIHNAGVMNVPYEKTAQGVDIQFVINHLGHFALCGKLMDVLLKTPGSRVVNVSSISAHDAVFEPENIYAEENYDRIKAYKFSKLANLYFSLELDRRFKQHHLNCIAVAAHPGYSKTDLQRHSKGLLRRLHILYTTTRYGQSAKAGALPILRAATEPHLSGKEYFYPDSPNGLKGFPIKGHYPEIALNEENARILWDLSERLTNTNYSFSV